ncbi:MAG TPA: SRPBCC family protein [Kofleriaceae bacterium]
MKSLTAARSTLPDGEAKGGDLARGLGWFSLALGAAELAMPRALARLIGIDPDGRTATVLRVLGAREIAAGLAVLMPPRRPLPLWSRVAGDAIDLAMLGIAARSRSSTARLAGATLAVAGVTALDVFAARQAQNQRSSKPVIFSVTINKPPAEVYAFYRKFDQLPQFMEHLESVERTGQTWKWTARLPIGGTVSWDAAITEDRPGELIAWQSVPGSQIKTRGRVTFAQAPGRNATEVRVEMQLEFPLVRASAALAKLFTKPQIKSDLRRLKSVMETGEVLRSDASVHPGTHPAQPSEHPVLSAHANPTFFIPTTPTAERDTAEVPQPPKGDVQ